MTNPRNTPGPVVAHLSTCRPLLNERVLFVLGLGAWPVLSMGFRHFSPSAHSLSLAYASTYLLDPAPAEALLREFPGIRFGTTRTVPMSTLDSWAEFNRIDRIDFIWFDMQGYELRALEGAHRLLPTTSAIQFEISNISLYEGAPLYDEVKARMDAWGFRPAVEAFFRVSGNVLFVRSKA
jgi:hypothetical protein